MRGVHYHSESLKSTSQSINQSIDQSINRLMNRPINQSIDRPIDQSTDWSINQSINRSTYQSLYHGQSAEVHQARADRKHVTTYFRKLPSHVNSYFQVNCILHPAGFTSASAGSSARFSVSIPYYYRLAFWIRVRVRVSSIALMLRIAEQSHIHYY